MPPPLISASSEISASVLLAIAGIITAAAGAISAIGTILVAYWRRDNTDAAQLVKLLHDPKAKELVKLLIEDDEDDEDT